MLEIGQIVDGKYKILNKIGQGGMSVVYLAMNERANKQWAIKEVRKDGVSNFEVVRQGLIAETDLLKRLNHPNLPSIIDVIDGEGTFLIVMDYIEGNSLSKALNQYGAQPQEDVIEWAKQLCDVLGYLHSRQPAIIYRDMKPSNVMLKPDGTVTLIDFGTAREFKSHSVADTTCLGTQGYAAPEQFGGHGQTDARTDIYCLGATLYHLVTGHNPCDPPYEMYPIRQWNPNLSSGFEEIILKCTQKNPNDRYQSCAELMYALEHYQELDEGYKKVQKAKWRSFLAASIVSVSALIATIGFGVAENIVTQNSYDYFIEQAQNVGDLSISENYSKAYDYYKQAIKIEPGKEEAYKGLIEMIVDDKEFTQEENDLLNNDLNISSHSETLKNSNQDGYGRFAYELAKSYFFYYGLEGDTVSGNGASKSVAWYDAASKYYVEGSNNNDDKYSTENIRNRATTMKTLANFIVKANNRTLGKGDVTGESSNNESYSEYFNQLYTIIEENKETNSVVVLRTYKLMVNSLIIGHISDLKAGGVSSEKIQNVLTTISSRISELENSLELAEIDEMNSDINLAKTTMNQKYGLQEIENIE